MKVTIENEIFAPKPDLSEPFLIIDEDGDIWYFFNTNCRGHIIYDKSQSYNPTYNHGVGETYQSIVEEHNGVLFRGVLKIDTTT